MNENARIKRELWADVFARMIPLAGDNAQAIADIAVEDFEARFEVPATAQAEQQARKSRVLSLVETRTKRFEAAQAARAKQEQEDAEALERTKQAAREELRAAEAQP